MAILKDISGQTFNMLHVDELAERRGPRKRAYYKCTCACGNTTIVRGENLRSGAVKSCGCLLKESPPNKTHGMKHHPMYSAWQNMKNRCYNKNVEAYKHYGAKGVEVCDNWKDSFDVFHEWLIANKWAPDLEIDRIDNDGPYCPENCRLVTRQTNLLNKGLYSTSTTGHTGIGKYGDRYIAKISINGKLHHVGIAPTVRDAVILRNKYIIDNDLPNKVLPVPHLDMNDSINSVRLSSSISIFAE